MRSARCHFLSALIGVNLRLIFLFCVAIFDPQSSILGSILYCSLPTAYCYLPTGFPWRLGAKNIVEVVLVRIWLGKN